MHVIGREKLLDFIKRHPDVAGSARAWLHRAERAEWKSPQDLKDDDPKASLINATRFVFNIGGNRFRLDAKLSFSAQALLIVRIGNHKEYESWTF